jgi:UPF0716 protein FxsA
MGLLRIIGLLLLVPLLDAILLVVFGARFGWQLMVLVVVLTGLVGILLVRLEGRNTIRRIQQKTAAGEPPTDELIDGGLLLVSGAFLLTPGLVTDLLGFLFVVPLTRYPIRLGLKRWVIVPYVDRKTDGLATGNIYIGGFPDDGPPFEQAGTPGAEERSDDEPFDVEATDVEYDDVDDDGKSNA